MSYIRNQHGWLCECCLCGDSGRPIHCELPFSVSANKGNRTCCETNRFAYGGSCSTSATDWHTDRDDAVTTRKSLARYATPANCSAMPLQLPEKRPSAMLLDDWLRGLYPGRGIDGFIIPANYQSWLNNLRCWLCKCQRVVV